MTSRLRRMAMLALAALFLALSASMMGSLRRAQLKYDLTNEPVKGVDPSVVLATTVLGAFRGILVDVVWIRMEELKHQGKFFEIVQLADLACKLAPRFASVWDFHAWNMAYNVSVQIPQLDERWPWVRRGIELLQQQGIPNNPTVPSLYFSLGFIYMHKVGAELDDAHFFYKQALGLEMHEVLGGEGSKEALERFVSAPSSRRELLQDPQVHALYERCVAAGFDPLSENPDDGVLEFFTWIRRPESVPEQAREVLEAEQNQEAVEKLATFARARRLRQMNLDPQKMLELMKAFGNPDMPYAPFDWRSPYPHAMYWAREGLKATRAYKERLHEERKTYGLGALDDRYWSEGPAHAYHDLKYDRIIYGGLQGLVTRGRMVYDSTGHMLAMMGPDYRFTDAMIKYFQYVNDRYGDHYLYFRGVRSAYENFLKRVAIEFYYMGDQEQSRRYYALLQDAFPKDYSGVPFEEFVRTELFEYVRMMNEQECRNVTRGLLTQSYFCLGAGIDGRANSLYARAEGVAREWQKQHERSAQLLARRIVFDQIREAALLDIFAGRSGFPAEVLERLKERLPADVVRRLEEAVRKQTEEREIKPMDVREEDKRAPD